MNTLNYLYHGKPKVMHTKHESLECAVADLGSALQQNMRHITIVSLCAELQQEFVPKIFCSHCGHETDGSFYCSDECREECCNLG